MKFTKEQLLQTKVGQANKDLIDQATTKYASTNCVGGLPAQITKQDPVPTLVKKPAGNKKGKRGLVVCVTLIRCGPKLLDDDNLSACFKALRDSVATSLGVTDDTRAPVRWQCGQIETKGKPGTIVRIETL